MMSLQMCGDNYLNVCKSLAMPVVGMASVFSKFATHSLNGFSNYVKIHCINNYQDGCDIPNCYICSRHTHE